MSDEKNTYAVPTFTPWVSRTTTTYCLSDRVVMFAHDLSMAVCGPWLINRVFLRYLSLILHRRGLSNYKLEQSV